MHAGAKSYLEKGKYVNDGPMILDSTQLRRSRVAWQMG